jgi:hypothetical protein
MQLSLFKRQPPESTITNDKRAGKNRQVLEKFIPAEALDEVLGLLLENPVRLTIVKERTSKTGDYRAPFRHQPARITVNGNLNPYSFLLTLIHEMAHHRVWTEYNNHKKRLFPLRKRQPLPHGKEWKHHFKSLMTPFLTEEIYPPSILPVLTSYLENPKASSSADHNLSNVLRAFDIPGDTTLLESLPVDSLFSLHGKRVFRKKEKIRTRFRCICMKTNRIYLVSANAPVVLLK